MEFRHNRYATLNLSDVSDTAFWFEVHGEQEAEPAGHSELEDEPEEDQLEMKFDQGWGQVFFDPKALTFR